MKKYPVKPEIVVLAGAVEVGKFRIPEVKVRFNRGKLFNEEKATSAREAYEILKKVAGNMIQTQEMGIFLYLNRANKFIGYYKHTVGGTAGTIFDIKLIMAGAVKCLAHGIIACHNHPSGNLQPSDADLRLTKQLKNAAGVHDINLLDHIIITKAGFKSLADDGLLGLNGIKYSTSLKGTDMITMNNYSEKAKSINWSALSPVLKETHDFITVNPGIYGQDHDIDDMINIYLEKLNAMLESSGITTSKSETKTTKQKAVRPPKEKKPPKVKKPPTPKKTENPGNVVAFDDDMKILRRFRGFLGKTKQMVVVRNLHRTIERAFTEEKVTRKNSPWAGLIDDIEKGLRNAITGAVKIGSDAISFGNKSETAENVIRICQLEKVYNSVRLIKKYITFSGRETKEKAKKLHNEVSKALLKFPDIKYSRELTMVKNQLDDYIKGNIPELIPPVELHGLFGLTAQKKK